MEVEGWNPETLLEGIELPRYQLRECIGAGGMGCVFRAVDTRLDNHVIALKIFYPHLVRDVTTTQFEAEALIARRLSHPFIVQVFNYHRFSEELSCMSMEYVDGESLVDFLNLEPNVSVDVHLQFIAEIASGLAFAHRSGVLHRDIKPDNILISATRHAKVADFGISQLLSEREQHSAQKLVGTPQYMSPEQFEGSCLRPTSDVYSFGALLFFITHRRHPFEARTIYELARLHCESPFPLDVATLRKYPQWMAELIKSCTEKDPEQRFSSMDEVSEYLRSRVDIEIPEASKASGASFAKEARNAAALPLKDIDDTSAFVITYFIYAAFIAILLLLVFFFASNDIGYAIAVCVLSFVVAGFYCRKSVRVLIHAGNLLIIAIALVSFNKYSRQLAGGIVLSVEDVFALRCQPCRDYLDLRIVPDDPETYVRLDPSGAELRILQKSTLDLSKLNSKGRSLLHYVPYSLSAERFAGLLSRVGKDKIDLQDFEGNTALHQAVHWGNLGFLVQLLHYGANPNLINDKGFTPLALSINKGLERFPRRLLCYGANPNTRVSGLTGNPAVLTIAVNWQSSVDTACLLQAMLASELNPQVLEEAKHIAQLRSASGVNYRTILELIDSAILAQSSGEVSAFNAILRKHQLEKECECDMALFQSEAGNAF